MDYIKLERVQPFAIEEDQQPERSGLPSPPPTQVVVSRRPPPALPAATTRNVSTVNKSVFRSKSNKLTGTHFDSLREQLYNALPIPPQVVPVMASTEQIEEYENFFSKPPGVVNKYTISEVLDPFFGWSSQASKEQLGKILFVRRILTRISAQDMNFDVAIICKNRDSEDLLHTCLSKFEFNIMPITTFTQGDRGVYGLIVKIRRTQRNRQEYRPITRNYMDMLFIFDSACHTDHTRELAVFKGVYTAKPLIIYLVSMDSAEIRIHTYNRFINDSSRCIHWNTRVGDISNSLKQVLLYQPNRKPNTIFCVGYNDFVSQSLFNWLKLNLKDDYDSQREVNYEFKGPSKGALFNELMNFSIPHPPAKAKDPSPSPPKVKKPKPTVAQADAAMNAVLQAASGIQRASPAIAHHPSSVPKVSPKAKKNLTQIVVSNAKKPGTAIAGPSNPYKPVFAQPAPGDPHAAPAAPTGIHPDRMSVIQNTTIASSSSSPSSDPSSSKGWSGGATGGNASVLSQNALKRSRVTEAANDQSRHQKLAKTTFLQASSIETSQAVLNQESSVTLPSQTPEISSTSEALGALSTQEVPAQEADSEMPDASAIADELGGEFGDFLEKALKQFEADVLGLNIKL